MSRAESGRGIGHGGTLGEGGGARGMENGVTQIPTCATVVLTGGEETQNYSGGLTHAC